MNCTKNKCIHGSTAKSAIGTAEAMYWKLRGTYKYIDTIICPSEFMKHMLDSNPALAKKTITLHNFIDKSDEKDSPGIHSSEDDKKKDYVLFFGSYNEGKGVSTLLKACAALPEIPFVFAGSGEFESEINSIRNIKNVGFKSEEELKTLIREARFSFCPSELNKNCLFSGLESLDLCTPVVRFKVGGVPELIEDRKTERLFDEGEEQGLIKIIRDLWTSKDKVKEYINECQGLHWDGIDVYYGKILHLYGGILLILPKKEDYVLYFGRYSEEKGIRTLLDVCKRLPEIQFVFAGSGPLKDELNGINNIKNVGFQTGPSLSKLIREAKFTVYPSECYENCPFSVIESLMYGTPVLGSDIGGIPELIDSGVNGELFNAFNADDLEKRIGILWEDAGKLQQYKKACYMTKQISIEEYCQKYIQLLN